MGLRKTSTHLSSVGLTPVLCCALLMLSLHVSLQSPPDGCSCLRTLLSTPQIFTLACQSIHFKTLLVHKALNGLGPTHMSDKLLCYGPSRPLRWSEAGLFTVPRVETKHRDGIQFLPASSVDHVSVTKRAAPALSSFKTALKTFLFATAF